MAVAFGAAALLATLTACTASQPDTTVPVPTASTSTPASVRDLHNDADVEFAQKVIVYGRALAFARLAAQRSSDPNTQGLAESIVAAHAAEIDVMTSWLGAWGAQVPDARSAPATDRDTAMPGVATDKQLAALEGASGPAFDALFLSMMVEHHRGSIALADVEARNGDSTQARHFAATILRDQTAEIAEIESILRP
jgi:uncharacterized protein (DUF305 family)